LQAISAKASVGGSGDTERAIKRYIVKLCDFGMAALIGAADGTTDTVAPAASAAGSPAGSGAGAKRLRTQVGTPLYCAPEILILNGHLTAEALRAEVLSANARLYAYHPNFPGLVDPRRDLDSSRSHRSMWSVGRGIHGNAGRRLPPPPVVAGPSPIAPWCLTQDKDIEALFAARKDGYTASIDAWSLGVCLYVFLVGSMPFHEESDPRSQRPSVLLQHLLRFYDLIGPAWTGVSVLVSDKLRACTRRSLLCRRFTDLCCYLLCRLETWLFAC
jgi:serine/threonine protein kinase